MKPSAEMMPEDFVGQVADAYLHIYDLVYLRTHSLVALVAPDTSVRPKKKAWLLHDMLLGLIDDLDPGHLVPADAREKRRYRLLAMRYAEGLSSKAVADGLAISLRHYYREHDTAIEAVAALLWDRYGRQYAGGSSAVEDAGGHAAGRSSPPPTREAMLRAEVAHVQDFGGETQLSEVLAGAMKLAQELTRAKGLRITVEPPGDSPALPLDRALVRQILLGLVSYLSEQLATGEIQVRLYTEAQQQIVEMEVVGEQSPKTTDPQRAEQLTTLHELAGLQAAVLEPLPPINGGSGRLGYRLRLPSVPRHTVLLVDDNNDILELYQRYLQQGPYQAVPVQNAAEALRLASQLQPDAIVLDLMLPEQDGWEILQRLTNHPNTQSSPVVICSILRARQLALALGAAAFLEKPVGETEFLAVIEALVRA